MNVRALILSGDGINCEFETQHAFEVNGAFAQIVHINDLIEKRVDLLSFDIFVIPGGFSFGDEINSGHVLSLKLKYALSTQLEIFIAQKKAILGICNGFQVLLKLGILPNWGKEKKITLTHNQSHQFINQWQKLSVNQSSPCIWTKGITQFNLPIRHGEGRIVFKQGEENEIYSQLQESGQIVLTYQQNPNGSFADIAGLCDLTGLIFGLMPHPEAALNQQPIVHLIFKNIIQHFNLRRTNARATSCDPTSAHQCF